MAPSEHRPATSDELASLDLGPGHELAHLPDDLRLALARALGAESSERPAAALLAALRQPAAVARMLGALSGEGLFAAAILAFVTRTSASRLHEHLALRLGADSATRALDELLRHGLCARTDYEPRQVSMPAPLRAALRPQLAPVLRFDGPGPTFQAAEHAIPQRLFEDGVLLAQLAGAAPRMTQSGEIFKRELLSLLPLVQGRFADVQVLGEEIDALCELGLVAHGGHVEVPQERVETFAALELDEQLRRHVLARERSLPPLGPLFQLLVLAGAVPLTTLVELAELDASAQPTVWRHGRAKELDGPARVDLLLLQPGVGTEDVGPVRLVGLSASLAQALRGAPLAKPGAPAQPHLLPSMEAIVPPECPLPLLVELGRFLELESLQSVARMKLTRESVQRAARRGLSAEAMLERLGQIARFGGVPDNVARAVRDFSQVRPDRVTVIEGPVVVAHDEPTRQILSHDEELQVLLVEASPGVFAFAAEASAGEVRRRLLALGLYQPRDEEERVGRWSPRWDDAESERRLAQLTQGSRVALPDALRRRAIAALALAGLEPAPPGAAKRIERACEALRDDPDAFDRFLDALATDERARLRAQLDRVVDPKRPLVEQLDRLDRLVPDWPDRLPPGGSRPRPKRRRGARA